jgi:predicted RNase H-like HicB family nuclease
VNYKELLLKSSFKKGGFLNRRLEGIYGKRYKGRSGQTAPSLLGVRMRDEPVLPESQVGKIPTMGKGLMMLKNLKLIYWQGEKYYLGKLLEYPEIMTQGETLEELVENIKDAYYLMVFDDVPQHYEIKDIVL